MTFVPHLYLLIVKIVDLVIAHDGFLFAIENFLIHTGYFDYTIAFQILLVLS